MINNKVDLPQPDGPTIEVTFPEGKRTETSVRAVVGGLFRLKNRWDRPSTEMASNRVSGELMRTELPVQW